MNHLTDVSICAILSIPIPQLVSRVPNMWGGLDKLLELQKLDVELLKLDAEARAIPPVIAALEAQLTTARTGLDAAQAKAEQFQKERRAKERELEEATQHTKKKQARLFEIKTNEEYSAVLREIDALKQKTSKLEEEILEQMERADAISKAVTDAEAALKGAQAVQQSERQAKEAQLAAVQKELARLQETRKGQASRLSADLLRLYTRLMGSRDVAVVPVVDGSCQGCGMALTPQAYTEARRNDRMFTCPNCNRILYYPG